MIFSITPLKVLILTALLALSCAPEQNESLDGDLLPSRFPADFQPPVDYLTGQPLEGWGGGQGEVSHAPLVFIHGNAHKADNWIPLATYFAQEGYTWNELWALSYLQVVEHESYNSNEGNWRDVDTFVQAVIDYTGYPQVTLISHSLGVTVSRVWLKHTADYNQLESWVGIAGANHGVSFCNPANTQEMCTELGHPETEFLTWLNGGDETPQGDKIRWITVYNGTDLDMFFPDSAVMNDGSVHDLRLSPVLEGAINLPFPALDHFQLATSRVVFDSLNHYLE